MSPGSGVEPVSVVIEGPRVRYYYDRADGLAVLGLNQLAALEMIESPPPATG